MTPQSDEPDQDYDTPDRRSIFSALWFRIVLVLGVVGVVAALAMPYLLDWLSPPSQTRSAAVGKPASPPAPVKPPAQVPQAPQTSARTPAAAPSVATPAPPPTAAPAQPKAEVAPPKARAEAEPGAAARSKKPVTKPATKEAGRTARASAPKAAGSSGGSYWVQVGAFKDPERAKKLVAQLRDQNFTAVESVTRGGAEAPAAAPSGGTPAPTAGDRYDVLISGASPSEINAKLAAKGLAAEPSGSGVMIKPSLPLRDAVALSKDLAIEGFKVQVKRAGSRGTEAASAPPAAGGETLHRVRVGAFPDRKSATAALRELEGKGYKAFIARGE